MVQEGIWGIIALWKGDAGPSATPQRPTEGIALRAIPSPIKLKTRSIISFQMPFSLAEALSLHCFLRLGILNGIKALRLDDQIDPYGCQDTTTHHEPPGHTQIFGHGA